MYNYAHLDFFVANEAIEVTSTEEIDGYGESAFDVEEYGDNDDVSTPQPTRKKKDKGCIECTALHCVLFVAIQFC
jgi:hypothetical protein